MDWSDIGKLVGGVAPVLGTLLGGPIGGAAGQILASALGTDASPEAVGKAIQQGGETVTAALQQAESEAVSKWRSLAEIAKAQAEVGKSQVEAVNASIQAEAAKPDGWWGNWRTILAYELAAECPFWAGTMIYAVIFDKSGINDLVQASGLIMAWWGARFGVLGVHVWTGSNERRDAMGAPQHPTVGNVIGGVIKTVTGRK